MIKERKFEIGNFVRLASAGLEVAEFVDVRDNIIKRYKEVYGSDIDLNTANADGVFVNDIAIIINNILQVMKSLYSNLDVDTASGIYLDALCKLANVNRLPATHSVASLIVTSQYTTGSDVTFGDVDSNGNVLNQITFVDNSGTEWRSNASVTLGPGESTEITATCVESGPIVAPAGWINQTMLTMNLSVQQKQNAIQGTNEESDTELRFRRAQSSGANGITVLESLVGAMLEISGINDVYIYNNNTLSDITTTDTTVIKPHCVYVIIRTQKNININDSIIGELIYKKLTPGIRTTASNASSTDGIAKRFEFIPQFFGNSITYLEQNVYWKQAVSIHPTITITLTPLTYFTESEFETIANAIFDYANNIKLCNKISVDTMFMTVFDADPMFKGQRTYNILYNNVKIDNTDNPDTYYEYNTYDYQKSGSDYVLTISYKET